MEHPKEYYAFISYKREDKKEAKRLQHALEYYRLPNHLRQENPELPEYVRPVFRDMTDLEVGELSAQIHAGLEQSHFLIVVCSPRAAASKWVNDEVDYFISLGKQDKIIPYIIEGVPHASNPSEECYPPALLTLSKEKELLGANINEVGKDSATIRVVSRMFNIRFDTLYQRYEREQRRKRWMWIGGSILIALLGLSIGGYFVRQNGIIKRQKERLQQDSITMAKQLRRISSQNDSITSQNSLILSQRDNIQKSNRLLYSTNANLAQANAVLFHNIRVNEAKRLAERAVSLIDYGDSYLARMVALQALPPIRPYTIEAERALRRASGSNSAIIEGHTNYVYCACFSPDDKKIASGAYDGSIKIWDATNGKELYKLINDTLLLSVDNRLHPRFCLTISFSPDGKYILAGLNDGTARLWDATTYDEISRFNAKSDNVVYYNGKERKDVCNACACFNNNGSKVAVASYDGIVKIWNIKNSPRQLVSAELRMPIKAISFAPKGDIVMLISQNGDIKLYDYQKKKFIDEVKGCSADFSSDGKYIAYGGIGDHVSEDIILRDLNLKVNVDTLIGHKGSIESVRFSVDDKYIISASGDKTIKIWQVKRYFKKKWIEKWSEIETLEGHNGVVTSASFSHDGKTILSSSWDKTIRLWDSPPQGISNNYYNNHFATFNSKGNCILCANSFKETNTPYILDLRTNEKTSFTGHKETVWSVNYNPKNNNQFVSTSSDSTLMIWNIETKQIIHTMRGHKALVWYASYSPNGCHVVSASDDETIKIWDVQTGSNLFTGYGHKGRVWSVNYSPNGKQIVSASSDGTIKVWNGKAKCQKTILGCPDINARFAVFSPNGQYIAACYADGVIKIWDSKSYEEIKAWKGHSDIVNSISFSPDSRLILSASKDKTVIVWDVTQGIEIDRKVCLGEVTSVCFSHDSKQIVAALNTYGTIIWNYLPLQTLIGISQKRFKERCLNNNDEKLYFY